MDGRPLSYQSLTSILNKLDANKRLQIAFACPSLQRIERAVPFVIEHLTFHRDYSVRVNDKFYKFGIVREYPGRTTPKRFRDQNDEGGEIFDMDEYGFRYDPIRVVRTEGDLVIRSVNEGPIDGPVYIDTNAIEMEERNCNHCRNEIFKAVARGTGTSYYKEALKDHETVLLPYYRRQNNRESPIKFFIQLGVVSKSTNIPEVSQYHPHFPRTFVSPKPIAKVPYKPKWLYQAIKGFLKLILGGRNCAVQVKCLETSRLLNIIRLPVGVKFDVRELKYATYVGDMDKIPNSLSPVLEEKPLLHPIVSVSDERENLNVHRRIDVTNFNEITIYDHPERQDKLELVWSWPRVNFMAPTTTTCQPTVDFIEKLLKSDRDVGTKYKMGFKEEKAIIQSLGIFRSQFKENVLTEKGDSLLVLSMSNSKQLHLSYRTNIEYMFYDEFKPKCVLKMEIMACMDSED